jgi:hypothetical protein
MPLSFARLPDLPAIRTHQPTRLAPLAESPAAALTVAFRSEVLAQVPGAYGGLGGILLRFFSLGGEVLPKLVQHALCIIEERDRLIYIIIRYETSSCLPSSPYDML